jgi:hypothetical protein
VICDGAVQGNHHAVSLAVTLAGTRIARADLAWPPCQDFLVLGHSQFVLGNDRNRRCTGVTLTFC